MKTKIILTIVLTTTLLISCKPDNTIQTSAPVNFSGAVISYIDTNQFDQQVDQTMQQDEPEIEIETLSPFSSNNIPDRLNNWLSAITDTGGTIQDEPAEGERALGEKLKLIFKTIFNSGKYKSAEKYNAKLIYRRNESGAAMIEKVLLIKRE